MGIAKDELLARLVADVAEHGLGDRSLRELATSVGSSHRMLIYHFGSRDGLVAAIVGAVEAEQRRLMLSDAAAATDPKAVVRDVWARVSAPEVRPFVQLFFETVAYSSRAGRPNDLTDPWLGDAAVAAPPSGVDPVEVRVGIAVVRGLLVDVLTGGDVDTATEALERFLTRWA